MSGHSRTYFRHPDIGGWPYRFDDTSSGRLVRELLAFIDKGEGISEKVVQNLWKALKTTKPKGIGLGLVICKGIVEAHGGSIKVESGEGKGSAFTIRLPITQNAALMQLLETKCL